MKRLGIAGLLLALLLFSSCRTVPTDIPEDLTQAELIQLAQESADQENWGAALAYYSAIVERFPQDRAAQATARYEIAFIEYRRGNLTVAESAFVELLAMYDTEPAALPAWPRVLATRLLADIRERRQPNAASG